MIEKEDYLEPVCPLCKEESYRIPVQRIIEKLEQCLGKDDTAGAETLLRYWQADARRGGDLRGLLTITEEEMGLFRKLGKHTEALEAAKDALKLVDKLGLEHTISGATVWLNAGTVHTAAGEPEEALICFRRAEQEYTALLSPEDTRLAGLYNNMALSLSAAEKYPEARKAFEQALSIGRNAEGKEPEQAITLLNLADLSAAEKGEDDADAEIQNYLEQAEALLAAAPDSAENAYVFTKCAPVFDYYGWFISAKNLSDRAKAIYEGNR